MTWWFLFPIIASAAIKPCGFNKSLEAWLKRMSLPAVTQKCEIDLDEDRYLQNVHLELRGEHVLGRRADYEVEIKTLNEGEIGLNFIFYYFKKALKEDATQKKADEIEKEIRSYAKGMNMDIEKTTDKYVVKTASKSLEWENLFQFRLKPSKHTPDSRYKIKSIAFGIKIRLNRLEVYARLHTQESHPVFQLVKTYFTNGIHKLQSGKDPMFDLMKAEQSDLVIMDPKLMSLQSVLKEVHSKMGEL